MNQAHILLVEDDEDLSMITQDALQDAGYEVTCTSTIEDAETKMYENSYQLILLDINLPDETGFAFCKRIRKTYALPILFISARTSIDDTLTALELGGDDFLAKPYALKELIARVNAHMRRNYQFLPNMVKQQGPFLVDFQTRSVTKNGLPIALSEKEFDILAYLILHANQCISREMLFAEVWGMMQESEISTVSVHIRWLREKLEDDPSHPCYIKTVWGKGYCWEGTK